MNAEDIISSGLLESYVLGTASREEAAQVNALCKKHPELISEIEKIEESLLAYAEAKSPALHPSVKQRVMSSAMSGNSTTGEAAVLPLNNRAENKLRLYRFGMAASLLLFVTSVAYNILLQQKVGRLNSEISELYASKSYLAQEIKIQQASINGINQRLQIVTNPGVKSITLNGMNSLANRAAMVYWNSKTDEVYFNISGLPDSPTSRQYQLWAIVNGKPVDAGVIDMSAGDAVFQKMRSIKGASAFAVTIEKEGGSPTPTLETMCLLGNV